jgi:hypothetical protein
MPQLVGPIGFRAAIVRQRVVGSHNLVVRVEEETMRMRTSVAALACLCALLVATSVAAQGGNGSLRGTVVDEQGAAMPGVTVTATSPAALAPGTDVTDAEGNYRITNLPPGEYTVTAELPGFAVYRRENVLLRASANFQIEAMVMKVGTLEEAITVSGRSPMVEVSNPTTTMNIDAEFQEALPLTEGGFWTDFLQMTPGVLSRPHNDGSGRQNYYASGVEHREHVTQMDGFMAANYWDMNVNRTGLSSEAIADTNVKLAGVDAAAPMGYGLVINTISKSGGNTLSGSAGYTIQPYSWNGNNAVASRQSGIVGTPGTRKVDQFDISLGGPVQRDRTWVFGAYRRAFIDSTVDRSPNDIAAFQAFRPSLLNDLPANELHSHQPFIKVTSRLASNHELVGVWQYDRMRQRSVRSNEAERTTRTDVGGGMYGVSLQSTFGQSVTTKFAFNYNDKQGNDPSSYEQELIDIGVPITIFQTTSLSQGLPVGEANIFNEGGYGTMAIEKSNYSMIRGDVTWYKQGMGGSHEFQTGFLALPRNYYKGTSIVLDPSGQTGESRRLINPNDLSSGTIAFARSFRTSALEHVEQEGRDRDMGIYVQDTWRPNNRLTATLGIRADFVRRFDILRSFEIEKSVEIAPRLGAALLLDDEAKNVVRGSFTRVHRQLMGGRDAVAGFADPPGASSVTTFDLNGDGIFEAEDPNPAVPASVEALRFDPDFHQPYVDEWTAGYQRQLPLDMSLDLAFSTKFFKDSYAQTEINGFWPDAPGQPFGGFGRVDPASGQIFRLTNRTWAHQRFHALYVTLAKNMSHNFQVMASVQRQWQQEVGDWNPTDPARFIQPDAFANNRTIWRNQDPADHNSLATGGSLRNIPTWTPGSFRLAGTWNAPGGIVVSSSYTMVGGPWTGPILRQLASNDPDIARFGTPRYLGTTPVPSGNPRGSQANPLATRIRFLNATRSEGQEPLPYVHTINIKLGYRLALGNTRHVQLGLNVFNLLNSGRYTEWHRSGANLSYNPTFYLQQDNQQTSRAAQFDAVFRF